MLTIIVTLVFLFFHNTISRCWRILQSSLTRIFQVLNQVNIFYVQIPKDLLHFFSVSFHINLTTQSIENILLDKCNNVCLSLFQILALFFNSSLYRRLISSIGFVRLTEPQRYLTQTHWNLSFHLDILKKFLLIHVYSLWIFFLFESLLNNFLGKFSFNMFFEAISLFVFQLRCTKTYRVHIFFRTVKTKKNWSISAH